MTATRAGQHGLGAFARRAILISLAFTQVGSDCGAGCYRDVLLSPSYQLVAGQLTLSGSVVVGIGQKSAQPCKVSGDDGGLAWNPEDSLETSFLVSCDPSATRGVATLSWKLPDLRDLGPGRYDVADENGMSIIVLDSSDRSCLDNPKATIVLEIAEAMGGRAEEPLVVTEDFRRHATVSFALPEYGFAGHWTDQAQSEKCSAVAPGLALSLEFEQSAADYRQRLDCVRAP